MAQIIEIERKLFDNITNTFVQLKKGNIKYYTMKKYYLRKRQCKLAGVDYVIYGELNQTKPGTEMTGTQVPAYRKMGLPHPKQNS